MGQSQPFFPLFGPERRRTFVGPELILAVLAQLERTRAARGDGVVHRGDATMRHKATATTTASHRRSSLSAAFLPVRHHPCLPRPRLSLALGFSSALGFLFLRNTRRWPRSGCDLRPWVVGFFVFLVGFRGRGLVIQFWGPYCATRSMSLASSAGHQWPLACPAVRLLLWPWLSTRPSWNGDRAAASGGAGPKKQAIS
jgi:hypothetical protein